MATAVTALGADAAAKPSPVEGRAGTIPGVRLPCPQCGALVTPPYQVETFSCPWCGSTLHPSEGPRVFHLVERPRLAHAEAAQVLRGWLAGPDTPRGLEDESVTEVGGLHLFPFMRVKGQGREHIVPLAPLPLPDLWDLALVPADMAAAPDRPGPAPSSQVVDGVSASGDAGPAEVASVTMDPDALRNALRAASEDPSTTEVLIEERAFYPARYRFRGEHFTAVIPASGGAVLAGRRPARPEVVGERLVAAGVFGLLFAEAALLPGIALKLVAIAASAAGLYPGLRWLVHTRL